MTRIRLLGDQLISQIAAGEVVERPASVLKELVENALDAGATDVAVELEAGGKRRIVIRDDGTGMDANDALLAFDRHATSKISEFEDLERVGTFGFRGEALASIASVARVELRTAEAAGDGHRVRIEGGRVVGAEPISHPRGTQIEVASLFFNVPARQAFLKRPQTELRHCLAVVQGYAMARPDVRFTLVHQGRTLVETTPVSDDLEGLGARIGQIFGRRLREHLIEIPPGPAAAGEAIEGFVGDRDTAGGRRHYVFVNRRLVRDRAIMSAFYRSARDTWKSDAFPALFLFLALDPEMVDVNVHPQKAEVRFREPGIISRVAAALRLALEETRGEEPAPLRMPEMPPTVPAWEGLGGRHGGVPNSGSPGGSGGQVQDSGAADGWQVLDEVREGGTGHATPPYDAAGGATPIAQPTFQAPSPRMVPLSGRGGPPRRFRILGQYKGSLILLEGPGELLLIDQHVAHERVLYERMRRSFATQSAASQRLIEPALLELGPAEAHKLEELAPHLAPIGFEIEVLSGGTAAIRALPDAVDTAEGVELVERLATSDEAVDTEPEALARKLLDNLAADASCKAAVKMHRPMSMDEMEALISELFRAEQPYSCPHGRPVVLEMSDAELERRFGRR